MSHIDRNPILIHKRGQGLVNASIPIWTCRCVRRMGLFCNVINVGTGNAAAFASVLTSGFRTSVTSSTYLLRVLLISSSAWFPQIHNLWCSLNWEPEKLVKDINRNIYSKYIILTRALVTVDGGVGWWIDLLTRFTINSYLQAIQRYR
jgi:hypothetical protein